MRLIFLIKVFFGLFLAIFVSDNSCRLKALRLYLGPDEIGENQAWTITITVQNDRLKSYDNFPEIHGFRKRGQSTQSTTNIVNGQISVFSKCYHDLSAGKAGYFYDSLLYDEGE